MILTNTQAFVTILVIAAGTAITRFLPYILFPNGKKTPELVKRLQLLLPCAVIGMLVVYCLKNVNFLTGNRAIPEIISIVCIVLLHIWLKNALISIGAGTAVYMLFVQFVF